MNIISIALYGETDLVYEFEIEEEIIKLTQGRVDLDCIDSPHQDCRSEIFYILSYNLQNDLEEIYNIITNILDFKQNIYFKICVCDDSLNTLYLAYEFCICDGIVSTEKHYIKTWMSKYMFDII